MEKSKISLPKFILLFTIYCLLSTGLLGCATYKFHHGKTPYNKGFVVSRDDYAILEYTLGKDDSVPNLRLAKERFKRRRDTVEYYYKKMGIVENHFKMVFWDPAVFFLKMVGGVFRLPFVAVSEHRYEHNPKYRERIKKIEAEKDSREEARIKKLKDELDVYIQKDLAKESLILGQPKTLPLVSAQPIISKPEEKEARPAKEPIKEMPVQAEPKPKVQEEARPVQKETVAPAQPKQEAVAKEQAQPSEEKPKEKIVEILPLAQEVLQKQAKEIAEEHTVSLLEKKQSQVLSERIVAVIIARPTRGYSPLKVKFDGRSSHSKYGKIISYHWEFGDGDTSTKASPANTYLSGSFMPKYFTVTLTIQDEKGNTAKADASIEILNR